MSFRRFAAPLGVVVLALPCRIGASTGGQPLDLLQANPAQRVPVDGVSTLGFGLGTGFLGHDFSLVERQRRTCSPGYSMCPDALHCTPGGYFCCPNNNAQGCPLGTSCCPSTGCARSGHQCCPGSAKTCPVNWSCCPGPSGDCAPAGGSCCGASYCNQGETCCEKGCAARGYSCCGPDRQCPSNTKCCKDEDGELYCAEECIVSLIFPYVKGLFDEIYENMCRGTAGHGSTNDPNTAILTLETKTGKDLQREKARRRRAAFCQGSRRIKCKSGESCDEFPFASSIEGGSGSQIMCVPREQNDWQGTYYGSWLSEMLNSGKLARGGKYRVKLAGIDCSKFVRRDLGLTPRAGPVLSSNGNVTVLSKDLFGNYSKGNNAMYVALTQDESTPGTYRINYTLSRGTILSGAIVDDEGETLQVLSTLATGSSNSTTVELGEDYGDITLFGWTKEESVQIRYNVDVTPAAATTTTSGIPASTSPSSSEPGRSTARRIHPSILMVAALWACLL